MHRVEVSPREREDSGVGRWGGRSSQVIGGCWEPFLRLREGCAFPEWSGPPLHSLPAERWQTPGEGGCGEEALQGAELQVPAPSASSAKPLHSSVLGSNKNIAMRPRSLLNECCALGKTSRAFTGRKEFHYCIFCHPGGMGNQHRFFSSMYLLVYSWDAEGC